MHDRLLIEIEDDGIGMTDQEFRERWMTLNYDRQRRQGIYVEFPPDAPQTKGLQIITLQFLRNI